MLGHKKILILQISKWYIYFPNIAESNEKPITEINLGNSPICGNLTIFQVINGSKKKITRSN